MPGNWRVGSNAARTVTDAILAEVRGPVGQIIINRPRALNALDLPMFAALAETLTAWRDDASVRAVVVRGAGGSFSAGGDIRAVRTAALADDDAYLARMYSEEYRLNALIARYPKPYLAAIDGYCMGGGLGVAVHGTFRAVSARAVLAMPETGIGFFPDVGMSHILPRLPDRVGWYAGLTGYRFSAADALAFGLATHQLDDELLADVESLVADDPDDEAIALRLRVLAATPGHAPLEAHRDAIARCFDQDTLLDVIAALEDEGTVWASETLAALRRASPTALAVTFELFRRGAELTVEQCLEMEYQLAVWVCRTPEFLEGVRAMVIDKDRAPKWDPARVEDLRQSDVDALWHGIDVSRNELGLTPPSP
jgi:enoyl-CoA hydratase